VRRGRSPVSFVVVSRYEQTDRQARTAGARVKQRAAALGRATSTGGGGGRWLRAARTGSGRLGMPPARGRVARWARRRLVLETSAVGELRLKEKRTALAGLGVWRSSTATISPRAASGWFCGLWAPLIACGGRVQRRVGAKDHTASEVLAARSDRAYRASTTASPARPSVHRGPRAAGSGQRPTATARPSASRRGGSSCAGRLSRLSRLSDMLQQQPPRLRPSPVRPWPADGAGLLESPSPTPSMSFLAAVQATIGPGAAVQPPGRPHTMRLQRRQP
jgi:hypothetical protein